MRALIVLAALTATAHASDWCADLGWYGDGICDADCPQPDPDCEAAEEPPPTDFCETEGWYGDGICDADCPEPDPDCGEPSSPPTLWVCGWFSCEPMFAPPAPPEPEDDWCAAQGWYGDGVCDADCPQPDPDCD